MEEKRETINIAELFGENVFSDRVMRERLPNAVYRRVKKSMTEGYELERDTADAVAQAMKAWAVENGATHYTHWFQQLSLRGRFRGPRSARILRKEFGAQRNRCLLLPVRRPPRNL